MIPALTLWDLDDTLRTREGLRAGIADLLPRTRNGLITFQRTADAIHILRELGIEMHFPPDLVYGCEPPVTAESKVPLVLQAIWRAGVRPEETLVIGDQYGDVLAAKRNGAVSVYLNADPQELELMRRFGKIDPDHILSPERISTLYDLVR